jgi:hypothetical protein
MENAEIKLNSLLYFIKKIIEEKGLDGGINLKVLYDKIEELMDIDLFDSITNISNKDIDRTFNLIKSLVFASGQSAEIKIINNSEVPSNKFKYHLIIEDSKLEIDINSLSKDK